MSTADLMTVAEFLNWVPPGEWGQWELVDGRPRRRMRTVRRAEIVAMTPEELLRYLEQER